MIAKFEPASEGRCNVITSELWLIAVIFMSYPGYDDFELLHSPKKPWQKAIQFNNLPEEEIKQIVQDFETKQGPAGYVHDFKYQYKLVVSMLNRPLDYLPLKARTKYEQHTTLLRRNGIDPDTKR